jgi:hypothetical protein
MMVIVNACDVCWESNSKRGAPTPALKLIELALIDVLESLKVWIRQSLRENLGADTHELIDD